MGEDKDEVEEEEQFLKVKDEEVMEVVEVMEEDVEMELVWEVNDKEVVDNLIQELE